MIVKLKSAAKKPAAKKQTRPAPPAREAASPAPAKKPVAKKAVTKKPPAKPQKAKTKAKTAKPPQKAKAVKQARKPKAAKADKPKERRQASGFRVNEHVVYPAHGVGQISEIAQQEIAGITLDLFVVHFVKEKMTLRIPLDQAKQVGMRKLANPDMLGNAMATLRGRARIKRSMWSRRAQEYEAKINSGDIVATAEVVRDLYRRESEEQAYSERQLYEKSLERMAREYAAIKKLSDEAAIVELEAVLEEATRNMGR